MSLIVKTDVNTASQYKVGNISTKYNGKKHKVLFRVFCDDVNIKDAIQLSKESSNIVGIVYQGLSNDLSSLASLVSPNVNLLKEYNFGSNITLSDVKGIVEQTPSFITPIIILPESFTDLHLIYDLCSQCENVRFTGGKLFPVDGVRIGYCSQAQLEKHGVSAVNSNMFSPNFECGNEVVDAVGLEFTVSTKAVRSSSNSSKSPRSSAPKTSQPKTVFFSSLLKGNVSM